jgi:zinc protease
MMASQPASGARRSAPPPLGAEPEVLWPRRTSRTLANGLRVVLVESHTIPKVSLELLFRSGNAVAAHEQPALAEMTATVVRTGTAARSSRQIEEDLRRMGADLGTSAGTDSSAISISGLAEFSAGLLDLVLDLAQNATFSAAELDRERRQRLEELRIERATPGFLAGERLRRVLFGEHPYAVVAPTEADVGGYRREDLERYYRAHYVPANALLLAVGDFDSEKMLAEIEKRFGAWKGSPPQRAAAPAPPSPVGRRIHLVHLPGSVQTEIRGGNLAITRAHPDWFPLAVGNAVFGGAFNSRLVMNIREQKGYTYSPRSAVHALREHGYFSVQAAVRNDVVAASLTEIFYELDRMRSLPVETEELGDTQNYLSGVFSLGIATQDGLLGQLATVCLHDLPEDYLETYRQRVRAVAPEHVLAAARRWFDSANLQVVVVGDRAQIGEQAELFGEAAVYDAQGHRIE